MVALLVQGDGPERGLLDRRTFDANTPDRRNDLLERLLDFVEHLILTQLQISQDGGESVSASSYFGHWLFTVGSLRQGWHREAKNQQKKQGQRESGRPPRSR